MATWTFNSGTNLGEGRPAVRVLRGRFDLVNASGIGFGDTFAIADIIQWFNVQPGWVVLAAGVNVVSACDASSTLTLGDTGSSTRYNAATTAATTGFTISTTDHAYTAADTIQSTVGGHSIATGIVEAFAVIADAAYIAPAKAGVV